MQDPHRVAWTDSLAKQRIDSWKSLQVSLEAGLRSLLGRLADLGQRLSCAVWQCGEPLRGGVDKRFCRDACRTRFGRERRAREWQVTLARLARLAGVK